MQLMTCFMSTNERISGTEKGGKTSLFGSISTILRYQTEFQFLKFSRGFEAFIALPAPTLAPLTETFTEFHREAESKNHSGRTGIN